VLKMRGMGLLFLEERKIGPTGGGNTAAGWRDMKLQTTAWGVVGDGGG